ncbi:THAP domain-containing protein 2-like [Maniola jurtina]|uniref:THAP domain-containing protein 2-like n=1 Tax=Maniola jurtina TaxID=191418 RepID=UPI001E68C95F|nr:THAP domain-containing protein 2-like [Maniola jurtina]
MCEAVFCASRSTKGGLKAPELSFHRFPTCPEVRNAWLRAIRRENWEPKIHARLCSKHFEPSCYVSGLKIKRLKSDAVPTIFEDYPKYYQPVVKKRKLNRAQASCNVKPEMSQTFEEVEPSRNRELTVIEDGRTLADKRLLETMEKVQATSDRRLKKIKILRESRRRALKKIASLKNIIKDLKNTCTLAQAHTHIRTYKIFVKDSVPT